MVTDVAVDLTNVNLMPSTEYEEVVQNVQMILATMKGTVPLDRNFGIDGRFLDEPTGVVQARAAAEITSAINSQEPRARVQKVFFDGDLAGNFGISVRIEIVEEKLRGGVSLK
ncbi:MAG: GPW/gp25 family protein [Selenomonadaceae bacterium]|nr:GPW/gp25 family protein [Selenomonadaceae bacterium]